jgi:hypothetical protein
MLPVPAPSVFEIQEKSRADSQAAASFSVHAEQTLAGPTTRSPKAGASRVTVPQKPSLGHARQPGGSQMAVRGTRLAARAGRSAPAR